MWTSLSALFKALSRDRIRATVLLFLVLLEPTSFSATRSRTGAVMAESRGWQRPSRYGPVESEVERIRSAVGLFDISPSGKLAIQGADIDSLFGSVFADVGPIEIGRLRVQLFGEMSDLQTVLMLRLATDEALVLTEPDEVHSVYEALRSREDGCAHAVDITSGLAGVRVTGPSAPLLLASLTELDVSPASLAYSSTSPVVAGTSRWLIPSRNTASAETSRLRARASSTSWSAW
ncbi:MAG: Aminomethyltransferase [Alphaproteobacteria bacterium MarineAlpha3_Bin1]|nr:MAG: Aminomethyltransferase [Alphaproteobacteria bacterium MarineAlpha3_Bin1]